MMSNSPSTLVAKNPLDLLALVPVVLGFHPTDSVVLLTFGGSAGGFHARCDLPPPAGYDALAAQFAAAAAANDAETAAVLVYTEDDDAAGQLGPCLAAWMCTEGVDVVTQFRVSPTTWRRLGETAEHPYDLSTHPFVAERVWAGQRIRSSRAELESELIPVWAGNTPHRTPLPVVAAPSKPWLTNTVNAYLLHPKPLNEQAAATMVAALSVNRLREVLFTLMSPPHLGSFADLFLDLTRRCREEWVAGPASLLALASWASGDGARAWCAVDRARVAEPEHPLVDLVAQLLETATPPSVWRDMWRNQADAG